MSKTSYWRLWETQCFSSSPKAGESSVFPLKAVRQKEYPYCRFLFCLDFQLKGWSTPTLQRANCFTQSIDVLISQTHPKCAWSNIQALHASVKLILKLIITAYQKLKGRYLSPRSDSEASVFRIFWVLVKLLDQITRSTPVVEKLSCYIFGTGVVLFWESHRHTLVRNCWGGCLLLGVGLC